MKHRLSLLATLLLAVAIPQSVKAYDFSAVCSTGQTLYYNISGSNISVTYPAQYSSNPSWNPYNGYTNPTGSLEIPSSVTYYGITYSVTSIGSSAFHDCSGLTSVTIPNSVTSIDEQAFYGCTGLTSVTIPNSVTSIDEQAFYGCAGLTSVTIGGSVTSIGSSAFWNCSGLTSVSIPNSVTSIGNWAFASCYGLTSVFIPNSVNSIGNWAFKDVRHIEYYGAATGAPWGAISMNGIVDDDFVFSSSTEDTLLAYIGTGGAIAIPNTVTMIGKQAFYGCSGLTSVIIPNSVIKIDSLAFYNCNGLISVVIPNSVTSIGYCAFYVCSGLSSISIPNSVTTICSGAFWGCSSLSSVLIPNSVTTIGESPFSGCSNLTSILVQSGNTHYDSRNNCNAIIQTDLNLLISGCQNTIIPNTVTTIGTKAFFNFSSLTSVTIPNSVTSIGSSAFWNCSGLTEITCLGAISPALGSNAFYNVSNTIPVNIPCGSTASYQSAWSYFRNFNETAPYSLDAQSADETMGSVIITSRPDCYNADAVVNANANAGYRFDHWSDGATYNPYTLTVTQDTILVAYFVSTEGIGDVDGTNVKVTVVDGQIVVENVSGNTVTLYDIMGRHITFSTTGRATECQFDIPMSGTYLVKIGNHPAHKIVVIK